MKQQVFIPTEQKFRDIQNDLFERMLEKKLPKLIRAANRKDYLTTKDLKEDFGISYDLQRYYRDENLIDFSQEGRKIWYPTESVEQFLESRKIKAKK